MSLLHDRSLAVNDKILPRFRIVIYGTTVDFVQYVNGIYKPGPRIDYIIPSGWFNLEIVVTPDSDLPDVFINGNLVEESSSSAEDSVDVGGSFGVEIDVGMILGGSIGIGDLTNPIGEPVVDAKNPKLAVGGLTCSMQLLFSNFRIE